MSMTKGFQTVIMFGVLVVVVTVMGILVQNLFSTQVTAGTVNNTAFIIAGDALNSTTNTATQLNTAGTIVGIFVLVIIAVAMLMLLVGLIKKFGGGGKGGGRRNGPKGGGEPIYVIGR